MKPLKLLFSLILMGILSGCGTLEEGGYDTSGFQTIDNSEITPFYTDYYGYYGDDVMFGETTIVGEWLLYDVGSNNILYDVYFYNNAELVIAGDIYRYTYGLSRSGLSINISTDETIVITTSNIYRETDDGYECYRVDIIAPDNTATRADMCPIN
jgi:hypothetical protein